MIKKLLWGIGICIGVIALTALTIALTPPFDDQLVEVARHNVNVDKLTLDFGDTSVKFVFTDEDEIVILENTRVKDISESHIDIKETDQELSVTWSGEYKIHGFSFTHQSQMWLPLLAFKEYARSQHESDMLRYLDYTVYLPRGIETEILCGDIVDADGYEDDFNQYTNITMY